MGATGDFNSIDMEGPNSADHQKNRINVLIENTIGWPKFCFQIVGHDIIQQNKSKLDELKS
jgi:hypothetical protein